MSYSDKLSPSKGSIFSKWWFLILIVGGIVGTVVGIGLFGTIDLSGLLSSEVLTVILAVVLIGIFAKVFYDSHFMDYYLEVDYNNELHIGKKRGEFSFNLENKTFYGVDCGRIKVILLQGAVATHEKKVLAPSLTNTRLFSLQSFKGQRLRRIVLRGIPITDVNMILRLGWLGIENIEQQKAPTTVLNLKKLIRSPDWQGVIWLAPYVPDDIYKQFLFNERSLADIETTFEGTRDNLMRDFNSRLEELKTYYLHVGSEVFHQSAEVIRTTIESYETSAVLVTYMLSKHPSEVQDVLAAMGLESKRDFGSALEKKVREFEQLKDQLTRLGGVVGLTKPEVEEKISRLREGINTIKERIAHPSGKPEAEAAIQEVTG